MNFKKFSIFLIIIFIFAFFFRPNLIFAVSSDSINISQEVTVCNNNGICESELGENSETCPLECPAPSPTSPPTGPGPSFLGDTAPPVIYDLLISKITLTSAEIFWKTNEAALCKFFWGKTSEHELESIGETDFYLQHSTKLASLSSETIYYFRISCQDPSKNETEIKNQKFSTLALPDITPPANILNFEAMSGDSQIELKWQNPADLDFKRVRIMRNEKFYPRDPWDGMRVYDDRGNSFIDSGLENGVRYYYAAFSYDYAGNYSSGAVAWAVPRKIPAISPPEVLPLPQPKDFVTPQTCRETGFYWYDEACYLEPKTVPSPPEVEKIILEDFDFIQRGKKISLLEKIKIKIKTENPLTISLDYEKVPEVLKTIMISLEKDQKFFSFLLRINRGKTAYEAMFLPPEAGVYPLTITIFDYKNQILKKIHGQFEVVKKELPIKPVPRHKKINCLYIIIVIIIIGVFYFVRKFRNQSADSADKKQNYQKLSL